MHDITADSSVKNLILSVLNEIVLSVEVNTLNVAFPSNARESFNNSMNTEYWKISKIKKKDK